ncbi:acetylcholine receptor subunit alpha-type acr-16-like isoform X3 [Schistocerca gregaria]|uniref:acetylcholine receptor subunit alpha-type acr-16-like isoform X3 n=1 Tax=Schistocerca gregaria TaxID=7010 RepID=UPI00211E7BF6|nr:acetylcholine receptor subunit alpha-type acr-16-like isoform X3 [Schistocerca gregaria]
MRAPPTAAAWLLAAIACCCLPRESLQGPHEKRLLHTLLDHYNVLERPVANESDPLQLSFGLTLMQIIDVDEKNQLLITNIWLKLEWNDVNLRWNSSEFGGVKDLRIPPHRIWKPDVLMYNSADEGFDGTYPTNVVVRNNGSCLYVPPGIFKSTCKIDITWFPFDDQRCEMKFGSWTYDGFQLDLQLQDDTGGDISSFITNGEWDLLGVPGKRNEIYYNCCPEPYIDITFIIIIRRRTLYYFFNLIVPCVLIASMAVLGFTLPPDSGEKLSLGMPGEKNVKEYACCPEPYVDITFVVHIRRRTLFYTVNLIVPCVMISSMTLLGFTLPHECGEKLTLDVTVLLSLTFFLNMVAETMPPTSERPLIGTYFNCIMFMVASSVVSTILILNYHHRNADTHEMSPWIKTIFLHWLPCVLRMSRPGMEAEAAAGGARNKTLQLRELELKERSSKSLLANVLDIDDDFRHHGGSAAGTFLRGGGGGASAGDDSSSTGGGTLLHGAGAAGSCLGPHRELTLILKELRVITDKLRKEDEAAEVTNDWKFAAMVVDRLCLIVFTLFTVIATIAVLFSAPHIIVT